MADVNLGNITYSITMEANEASKSLEKLSNKFNVLNTAMKALGIGVAIKAFKDLSKSAFSAMQNMSDYIETLNLFRSTMGDATKSAEEFVNKAEKVLGLDPSMMMNSVAMLQTLAEGFGLANDEAYVMSKNLTQLAADMSSFMNISFESALEKIKSGFSGEVRAMRSMGVALDRATLQQTLYSLGIDKTYASLTRAQKTELIYYQMMTSTTKMQGDLARTMVSPQNALRILKQEFAMAGRAIGSIFIPLALKVIPVVRAVTQIIKEAAQSLAKLFGFQISDYESDISDIGTLLTGVGDDIDGVADSASGAAKELQKMLMPFDELNNINLKDAASGVGGIGGGAGGVGGSLGIDLPEYDMFTGAISNKVEEIKNKIKEMLPIVTALGGALALVWGVSKILNFIGALENVKALLTGGAVASSNLSAVLGNGFGTAIATLGQFALIVGGVIASVKGFIDIWGTVTTGIKTGNKDIEKLGIGLAEVTLGFAAIGGVIGGPMGVAIGALVGALAGVSVELIAIKKAQDDLIHEQVDAKLFGSTTISVQEWTQALRDNNSELTNYMSSFETYKSEMQGIASSFDSAAVSVGKYIGKFSTGVFQITEVDMENIKAANEELGTKAVEVVSKSTERSIQILSDYYRENDGIIDEGEKANLQTVKENGDARIEEINNIKNRDIEIWQKVYEEHRDLNEEERAELDEHYNRLREITDKHLSVLEGKVQLYQQKLLANQEKSNSNILDLDKESYNNFAQALEDYQKQAQEANEAFYVEEYNSLLDSNRTEEQARNEAYARYLQREDETNAKINEMRDKVLDKLKENYKEAEFQADEASKYTKTTLENVFQGFKLKDEDYKSEMAGVSKAGAELFRNNTLVYGKTDAGELIEVTPNAIVQEGQEAGFWTQLGWRRVTLDTGDIVTVDTGELQGIGWRVGKAIRTGIQNVFNYFKINLGFGGSVDAYATGGFPTQGQLFYAREDGPELIGNIGRKTAVANNDQITEGIANATYGAIMRAMSETGGRASNPSTIIVNVGNEKLYEGYGEYKDSMSNMYGVNL